MKITIITSATMDAQVETRIERPDGSAFIDRILLTRRGSLYLAAQVIGRRIDEKTLDAGETLGAFARRVITEVESEESAKFTPQSES